MQGLTNLDLTTEAFKKFVFFYTQRAAPILNFLFLKEKGNRKFSILNPWPKGWLSKVK